MSIVLDGTRGISASGGLYAANTFTGTYTGGVVVDYTSGKGRISVGSGDGLTIYNNGVANNALVTLDVYGRFTVNGGDNNGLWPSTAPGLYFQRTQSSAESNIPFIRAESDASTTNLLLGTSSSSGVVKFITGASLLERMRLDANGNLLVGTTSSNSGSSGLKITGPVAFAGSSGFTGNYTVSASDTWLTGYSLTGTVTITLPTPSTNLGRFLFIRTQSNFAINSASSNVTTLAGGAVTTSILAGTAGKWAILFCDGSYWNIFAAN